MQCISTLQPSVCAPGREEERQTAHKERAILFCKDSCFMSRSASIQRSTWGCQGRQDSSILSFFKTSWHPLTLTHTMKMPL